MINVRNKSLQEQKTLKHYYYSCAMKESLQGFIKTQAEAYKRYVLDRYKYGLKTLEVDYNDYIKEYFDVEKLNMYIAETYLNVCENTDDLISIDKYLPTLLKYSEELRKSIKSEDKKIDYEKRYRIIALNCRIINLRDRAEKLRNKKVNWNITHTPRKMIARKVGQPRIALFDFKKIERLKEINNEKSEFYTKNKPLLIVTDLPDLFVIVAPGAIFPVRVIALVLPSGIVILLAPSGIAIEVVPFRICSSIFCSIASCSGVFSFSAGLSGPTLPSTVAVAVIKHLVKDPGTLAKISAEPSALAKITPL